MRRLNLARRELAGQYYRYAMAIANRIIRRCTVNDPDLICSAALFGLCDAARRYDPARGVPFKTFASKRICGEIEDALRMAMPKGFRRGETPPTITLMSARVTVNGRREVMSETISSGDEPVGWELDSADNFDGLVRRLDDRTRHVMYLYFVAGWTQRRIGAFMGVGRPTINQRILAGIATLRERLTRETT